MHKWMVGRRALSQRVAMRRAGGVVRFAAVTLAVAGCVLIGPGCSDDEPTSGGTTGGNATATEDVAANLRNLDVKRDLVPKVADLRLQLAA